MEKKAKTKRSLKFPIAVLLIVITIFAITFLFFNQITEVSPLGTWIEVSIYCAETEEAIPDGLAVTLEGMGFLKTEYTKAGTVKFGSGIPDGTYTLSWYWNAPFVEEVTIDCSQIVWHYDFFVPNPVIVKHFAYGTETGESYAQGIPIVGLNVTLVEDGTEITWALTDATGTVTFGGNYVDVCKSYDLTWTWGGVADSEGQIHFAYENGELLVCTWEETNYLEPKSGELKTLPELMEASFP